MVKKSDFEGYTIVERWNGEKEIYKVVKVPYVLSPDEYFIWTTVEKEPNPDLIFALKSDAKIYKKHLEGKRTILTDQQDKTLTQEKLDLIQKDLALLDDFDTGKITAEEFLQKDRRTR